MYFKNKVKENIAKPKDLWKTLKSLGLFKNCLVVQTNTVTNDKSWNYDLKSVTQTNLAESLFKNLPKSPSKFDMNSVHKYYKKLKLKDNFNLTLTMDEKVLKGLQCIDISKAAGIDKILGRFLEDDSNILAKPLIELWNISISSGLFPSDCKLPIKTNQRDNSLLQNNILYNYQPALKNNHASNFCLSFLNEKILKDFDKGLFMEWYWLTFKMPSIQ